MLHLFVAFSAVGLVCGGTITVTTPLGKVRGYQSAIAQQFKGIPYAEPPVGSLRWNPPQSKKPWSNTLDALMGASLRYFVTRPFSLLDRAVSRTTLVATPPISHRGTWLYAAL